ncbi:hypothetical protein [Pseudopedobacter sp.]|uniref:hypothetical protein n=1 Tax=Pseudopedobacter sp. TaxID=1936787 RepID=UPI003341FAC0
MKKLSFIVLAFAAITLLFTACASRRGTNTMVTSTSKGDLTGTWIVSDIKLEGFPEGYQIKNAFNMAPYESFIGSTWRLYGSYKGSITLSNGTMENIYWDLINDGAKPVFQFKTVPDGTKARDIREGYHLDINWIDANHLSLRSPFSIENGNAANIVYNLEKQK